MKKWVDTDQNKTQNMHNTNSGNWNSVQTQIVDIQDFAEEQFDNFLDPWNQTKNLDLMKITFQQLR